MLALLDGDIFVYRIGYASDGESKGVAISRMASFVEDLIMMPEIGDYIGYLTGSNNYRKEIAKEAPYKGNRVAAKPEHYEFLREYLVKSWGFEMVEGQEADDAIGIKAYTLDTDDYMIYSIDKDLDMIRGWHYNFNRDEKYFVDEDDTLRTFYKQVLTGDRVDNIPGLKGIGPKKADKILSDALTEAELFTAVLAAYDGDILRMTEMAQLLWIRRKEGELWQPPS
jgi:5'-3' exonuclease